ncbi:ThiF family adenylyltransferase [Candidatus Chlorohelix sp.]|uniref:ThiF family adenylyltransferase n=1 Tax=Candidatus Chlorohelix sp. TaxID=3139201 RepID=UPI003056E258
MSNNENRNELVRYARQILYPGIGLEGQKKLLQSRVLIVGCGALGTSLANHLVRAGVGHLTIIDRDFIELNNLQRQILFDEEDLKRNLPKARAAVAKLRLINSEISIEALVEDFNYDNALELIRGVNVVLDGTDNFETRYLINDTCVKLGKAWVYSGVIAAYGITSTIVPGQTPCLRCLFPDPPPPGTTPTCDTAGIIGSIVGVISSIAAGEAIKLLVGKGTLNRGLLSVDLWQNSFEKLPIETPLTDCPCCGKRKFEYLESEGTRGSHAASLCGRNAVQISVRPAAQINLEELATRLQTAGALEVIQNEYLLRFKLDGYEFTVFPDARAIIKGTDDENIAKTLYSRYIGI